MSVLQTFLGGGVIDSDYRGNISIILTNFAASNVEIKNGDRIAQIMFLRPEEVVFEEVEEFTHKLLEVLVVLVLLTKFYDSGSFKLTSDIF